MRDLYDVAHMRTGDKGNLVTISVTAFDPADYPLLVRDVTPEVVGRHLGDRIVRKPIRYEMANIHTLLFVCERSGRDTVTTSAYLDRHGKSLGSALDSIQVSGART